MNVPDFVRLRQTYSVLTKLIYNCIIDTADSLREYLHAGRSVLSRLRLHPFPWDGNGDLSEAWNHKSEPFLVESGFRNLSLRLPDDRRLVPLAW